VIRTLRSLTGKRWIGGPWRGAFALGLTRDDAGGLRYLLSATNYNLERLLPDVHGVGRDRKRFVNLALRAGVERLTFVKRDYDSRRGSLTRTWSYKFVDTYLVNEIGKCHRVGCRHRSTCSCPLKRKLVPKQQLLERTVSQPDFLFAATDTPRNADGKQLYLTTGTSNWWSSAADRAAQGPGVIRPPVKISFDRLGPALATTDDFPPVSGLKLRWASFDFKNPIIIFPQTAPASQTNRQVVRLYLYSQWSLAPEATYLWTPATQPGGSIILQTSSNLSDWTTMEMFPTNEGPIEWNHYRNGEQQFFRVLAP